MDFGSSAEHCVQVEVKAPLKAESNTCTAFYFCHDLQLPKKPPRCAHYHILACHCGDGKCSSLLAIAVSVAFL